MLQGLVGYVLFALQIAVLVAVVYAFVHLPVFIAGAAAFGLPGAIWGIVVAGVFYSYLNAWMLRQTLGVTAGLVGTVENRIGSERYATAFTTPEAPALHRLLRAMVEGGCTHAAMEVSSHGLALDRVGGLAFDVAVFTNLTQDHLDYHASMDEYLAAKLRLFQRLQGHGRFTVINRPVPVR